MGKRMKLLIVVVVTVFTFFYVALPLVEFAARVS